MSVYLVDTGPHRSGRRWYYVAADGKQTTGLHESAKAARAAWDAGQRHACWQNQAETAAGRGRNHPSKGTGESKG